MTRARGRPMTVEFDGSQLAEITLANGRKILARVSEDSGRSGRYLSFDAFDLADEAWVLANARWLAERYDMDRD